MTHVNSSTLKALEVLELLAAAEDGLRLKEISASSAYPMSTVRRLLVSLIDRGYVEQDPQTSRYYPGIKIMTLQAQGIGRRHVGRRAYPYLFQLRRELGEAVNLGVLSDTSVIYLETLVPDSSFSFYAPPGTRMPLYCTAMGKVFLAHLPAQAQGAILNSLELKQLTPNTVTAVDELTAQLSNIVFQGHAVDDEEYALGVRCIAAPIHDHSGAVVAGVSVTAPTARMPPGRDSAVGDAVQRTCLAISQALGYVPSSTEAKAVQLVAERSGPD